MFREAIEEIASASIPLLQSTRPERSCDEAANSTTYVTGAMRIAIQECFGVEFA
jgi:hypothetical protein